ncbi:single-stranded DNA-binding protein (plasmid) [Deinococcus radiomollis]|uniref:single-stranded DNA-binding protein n=1 Tax=Deinococcus radiomollis TaxID=468916 RepID=UPI00389169B4
MKGSISGYVARVEERTPTLTIVSITGLTGDGQDDEHPFIQNIRFDGRYRQLASNLTVGEFVYVDVSYTYHNWQTPSGEARSQNTMNGNTLYRIEPVEVIKRDGYVCPLFMVNEIRLRVRLVRDVVFKVQAGKRICEARVACSDQGQAHYYNLTAWHDLASAMSKAVKGDTLMATVKARKEKWTDANGEHWRDHIEVRSMTRSPIVLQGARANLAGD